MIDLEAIWTEVAASAPPERRVELEPLRMFLSEQESPHARALGGRDIVAALGRESAEDLESTVLARIKDVRSFSNQAGAEWFRLLYDAQKRYVAAGGEIECFTRLALIHRPEPSPFSPPIREKARPVMHWREGLDRWMASLVSREPGPSEWQAGMVLSAVLYGQLIDSGKVASFVAVLTPVFPMARGRPFVEVHQKFAGLGDFHCQRWFVDPVTEMLGYRQPPGVTPLSKSDLAREIKTLLHAAGVAKDMLPRSVDALIESATAEWFGQSSRVDVEVMRRGVIAHGFHERTWARLFGTKEKEPSKVSSDDGVLDGGPELDWRADVDLFFPWWLSVRMAVEGGPAEVARVIAALRDGGKASPEVLTYFDWIEYLLAGHNATRKRLSASTIFGYATAAIPVLLSLLGTTDPASLDLESLAETYEEAMAACPPDVPGRVLAKALREFHSFLSRRRGVKPLESVRDVLGDDAGLEPVDANVLTIDEYFAARAYLDQLVLRGRDPDDVLVAKIAMTMAFRGGLRRMEIFGLRLIDISSPRHLELLIREHAGRRLKTQSSKRVVPIRLLMTNKERQELRQWIHRRHREEKDSHFSEYLFALPRRDLERVSSETVSDRIIEAICHATGHPKTRIHQLRHSFGTWLYLALRAPDYPGIEAFLEGAPRTRRFVSQGSRIRAVLGIGSAVTSRTYAFAVARLLGHSSPMVSLGHYIHSSEFLQYQLTLNRAERVQRDILLGLTRLKPVWGGRLLKRGIAFLLEHVRRQNRKKIAAESAQATSEASAPKKPLGRKPRSTPEEWLPLRNIHSFLHQCAASDRPPRDLACLVGIPEQKADAILGAAVTYAARFKLPLIGDSRIPDLPFPRTLAEQTWEAHVEARLKRAFALAPEEAMAGVMTHLAQFTPPKGDVVFRGEKERAALEIYTALLRLANFKDDSVEIVIRSLDDAPVPAWARRRLKILGRYGVRRVNPPVVNESRSYAPWVGILVRDGQSARPLLTRSLMLLVAAARTEYSPLCPERIVKSGVIEQSCADGSGNSVIKIAPK